MGVFRPTVVDIVEVSSGITALGRLLSDSTALRFAAIRMCEYRSSMALLI